MKYQTFAILSILVISNAVTAQTDLIFKSSFDNLPRLNDTGILWAGGQPSGNNADCNSASISSPQDCNTGRDTTHNDSTDGHAGFSFIKLDANGIPLDDQSVDYTITPWSCVKDNVTGLIWEVKTTSGIHNKNNSYQWGGLTAIGRDHPDRQGTYFDPSWNELVQGSNDDVFCGLNNWRLPTVIELYSIIHKGILDPAIDLNYFPNTRSSWFWSSSPIANEPIVAWNVNFNTGGEFFIDRAFFGVVRLVHSP